MTLDSSHFYRANPNHYKREIQKGNFKVESNIFGVTCAWYISSLVYVNLERAVAMFETR